MDKTARLAVRFGPDQGQTFPLATELVRIGRGADNEIILTDPGVADHHASIVRREGRYAIVTAHPAGLQIDDTPVPPERWIWLPDEASIRISPLTVLAFECEPSAEAERDEPAVVTETGSVTIQPAMDETPKEGFANSGRTPTVKAPPRAGAAKPRRGPIPPWDGSSGAAANVAAAARSQPEAAASHSPKGVVPAGDPAGSIDRAGRTRKGGEKKTRQTARFITDGPGAALVKLGEDGHLPELALNESTNPEKEKNAKRETNPLILIGALVVSLSMTLLMLFMDDAPNPNQAYDKAAARRELKEYLGNENDASFAPYQLALRRARQAWTRGDKVGERAELRRVLDMLRSEAKDKYQRFTGVTGRLDYDYDDASKRSDRRLEELIAALLADD